MAEVNIEVEILKEQVKELRDENKDFEKRLTEMETTKEKTVYQYDQIMKAIDKLNDVTIPNVLKELEAIKNKPAKRWETGINALISAIVAGVVAFLASKIGV